MRRPNRNVEVFSISALDLFASALGAFIIVAVILFPYYLKSQEARSETDELKSELEAARTELEETQSSLQETTTSLERMQSELEETQSSLEESARSLEENQSELEAAQAGLSAARIELSKTFLIVGIDWEHASDVDLHVTDPDGNMFFYAKNNRRGTDFAGTKAQLSYDMLNGPGIELWQAPLAKPGDYKIEYNLYSTRRRVDPVTVMGSIFERGGRMDLNPVTLRQPRQKVHAATVTIDAEGNVLVRQ